MILSGTSKLDKWRLLDTGRHTAAENIALDQTLIELKDKGKIPNTVRFLQFFPPAVLLGYHQSLEQEIRVEFCKKARIDMNRRITGGGTIFFDETQLGWEIICEKQFFNVDVADVEFFKNLSQPLIFFLKKLGINASFRPRNDIEIRGRKISGTGGTEQGNAFLFQGTLLVDFDVETMLQALRVPIEKLKKKEIDTIKERITCLKWELGYTPAIEQIKESLQEAFEKTFNISLVEEGLTKEEQALFKKNQTIFKSKKWVEKIRFPKEEQPLVISTHITDGGLLRIALLINLRYNRIENVIITGDFFVYPKRTIADFETFLRGTSTHLPAITKKINDFFQKNNPHIPGFKPADFVAALHSALEKITLQDYGIPLTMSNHIFPVNGSFTDLIKIPPTYLLLPYCAKSLTCGYRYKKGCTTCGGCEVGEAYQLAFERNMTVTTILSFEDLIHTLTDMKKQGVKSFIGCCCEAFYIKHKEAFEKSKLAGILVDIKNTTCYDLGETQKAYQGDFENETEIDISLLKKVLNVV